MWLEDFVPSESWNAPQWWAEISEKFKEAVKKSSAWIKRVQKDEKKARKYDMLLAHFLVEIIKNPRYDFLLDPLFSSLDEWYPSNFLLWILSLIHIDISHHIRSISWKQKAEFIEPKTREIISFSQDNITPDIQKRINLWIEDMSDVIALESSTLMIQNTFWLNKNHQSKEKVLTFQSIVFQFFFYELWYDLPFDTSFSYNQYIFQEVMNSMKKMTFEEV